ncbi:unnamed protein product [Gongylonema pulchrum]|uniref:Uncharacterized protein n=1 Tax=Gongylonema pulchrum TaxID=637853 RepID=A0A183D838_9BILA|nr:unnamed protein product [Gongylonema pulchrum]
MTEIVALNRLLQNTKFSSSILHNRFFPDNNNSSFTDSNNVATVTVLENTQTGPSNVVAFGAIHLYTSNQVITA